MRFQLLRLLAQKRKSDGLFIRKVVIERTNRRSTPLRDCRHRGGLIAYLRKQFRSRIQKGRETAFRALLLRSDTYGV